MSLILVLIIILVLLWKENFVKEVLTEKFCLQNITYNWYVHGPLWICQDIHKCLQIVYFEESKISFVQYILIIKVFYINRIIQPPVKKCMRGILWSNCK